MASPTRHPLPRDLWTAENEERLQSLKEMEISLEDTAIGRKKIVLKQQLNAATLSMYVTDKVERVIGDSKAKMEQGGGCRGR